MSTLSTDNDRSAAELFSGARRAHQYREDAAPADGDGDTGTAVAELPDDAAPSKGQPPAGTLAAPPHGRAPVTVAAPVATRPGQWGWRGRLFRGSAGLVKLAPGAGELEHREALATIRRATWTRAVNIIVTNPQGRTGQDTHSTYPGGHPRPRPRRLRRRLRGSRVRRNPEPPSRRRPGPRPGGAARRRRQCPVGREPRRLHRPAELARRRDRLRRGPAGPDRP